MPFWSIFYNARSKRSNKPNFYIFPPWWIGAKQGRMVASNYLDLVMMAAQFVVILQNL